MSFTVGGAFEVDQIEYSQSQAEQLLKLNQQSVDLIDAFFTQVIDVFTLDLEQANKDNWKVLELHKK